MSIQRFIVSRPVSRGLFICSSTFICSAGTMLAKKQVLGIAVLPAAAWDRSPRKRPAWL